MPAGIRNQLGAIRRSRGIGASDLARRVGVSRQTIHAIEGGSYMPNTEIALRLAKELEVPVEELFALDTAQPEPPRTLRSEILSATPVAEGQAVKVCQVGTHLVSIPVTASPYYLPEADGIVSRAGCASGKTELTRFSGSEPEQKRLVIAGCDPAIGLVSRMVEQLSGVELVSAAASSRLALNWLKQGKVHVAGSHLRDAKTGEFNLPFVRRELAGGEYTVITFAWWEEGFVTAPGNPENIRSATDLARRRVRFVNREPGSGSRGLLDRLLAEAGAPADCVAGYDRIAAGHLAAAYTVLSGEADCCLATRPAAQTFGLEFVPLQQERYDFVMRRSLLDTSAAGIFFDILQRATLRRKLEALAGYETSQTGSVVL